MSKEEKNGNKVRIGDVGVMFGLMLAMFVSAFIAIDKLDVTREVADFQHCLFGIVGMIFIYALYGIRFMGKHSNTFDEYFNGMILVLFIMFYMIVSSEIADGIKGMSNTIMFLSTWEYLMGATFCFLLWMYQRKYFPDTPRERILNRVMIGLCAMYALDTIINIFTRHVFVISDYGYIEYTVAGTVINSIILGLFFILNLIHILTSNIDSHLKGSLSTFFAIPLVTSVVLLILADGIGDHLFNLLLDYSLLLSLYMIFFNIHIEEQNEYYKEKAENTEMRTSIIASQIGPHFLYNALATISAICEEEGAPSASDAVAKFASYLRMNLDSLGSSKLVKFEEELEHVKTYLWLEHMRFGDDLRVEYNIGCSDFMIPPLVVQPIVENAVAHGVLMREDGGTVSITTMRQGENVVITVRDDGVGFDVDAKPKDDGRSHIGVGNVRSRLESLVGGTLDITSEIGKGTTAVITVPEKNEEVSEEK